MSYNIQTKWTKIGVNMGICLGNNGCNFQLYRFTITENIAKSFRELLFDSHCILSFKCQRKRVLAYFAGKGEGNLDNRSWGIERRLLGE